MWVILEIPVLLVRIFFCCVEYVFRLIVPRKRKDVRGKLVLVTGAGRGIGREIAMQFARYGARLALWDVNEEDNRFTAEEVRAIGSDAFVYKCDVSNSAEVRAVAERMRGDAGNVDILVNNADIFCCKDILSLTEDDIRQTINTNTLSHFWTIKECLPYMIENEEGHILTVASTAGKFGTPMLADYCASKSAVVALSRSLWQELRREGKTGIRVSIALPSFTNTEILREIADRVTVRARFDPVLEPTYIARVAVDGVLRNQTYIFIPGTFAIPAILQEIIPPAAMDLFADFFDTAFYSKKKRKPGNKIN